MMKFNTFSVVVGLILFVVMGKQSAEPSGFLGIFTPADSSQVAALSVIICFAVSVSRFRNSKLLEPTAIKDAFEYKKSPSNTAA